MDARGEGMSRRRQRTPASGKPDGLGGSKASMKLKFNKNVRALVIKAARMPAMPLEESKAELQLSSESNFPPLDKPPAARQSRTASKNRAPKSRGSTCCKRSLSRKRSPSRERLGWVDAEKGNNIWSEQKITEATKKDDIPRPTRSTSKTEKTTTNNQETAVEEPAPKKRAVEATCNQTENDRIDNLEAKFEARFNKLEQLITVNIAAVTAMKQTMETYQAENTNRLAYIERTLQPIVSHPTFAPLFAQHPPNQGTPYTPRQSWPPTQQQQQARKKAVIQQHIAHAVRKSDVILLQETPAHHPSPATEGLWTLVRKALTFVEHELLNNIKIEHKLNEIIPDKKRKGSIFLLTDYRSPSQRKQMQDITAQSQHRSGPQHADRVQQHGADEVTRRINDKYLPATPTEQHAPYGGLPNAKLDPAKSYDQDQQLWAIQQVLGALESQGPSEPSTVSGDPRRVTATP
ncbi:hypothetical protein HPB49_005898 [Dermacentor silvarum]|uniref:Uncharacterized protein n=1 Tax=Dermacentor silvarum TaxID=543639 RepID=A0ACB8C7L6_DERSI|nr:hypothetical protein HPB49_005898 [Dermacentor silvarum]